MKFFEFCKKYFDATDEDYKISKIVKRPVTARGRKEAAVLLPIFPILLYFILSRYSNTKAITIIMVSYTSFVCILLVGLQVAFPVYVLNYILGKKQGSPCKKILFDFVFSKNNCEHLFDNKTNRKFILWRASRKNFIRMIYVISESGNGYLGRLYIYRNKIVIECGSKKSVLKDKNFSYDDYVEKVSSRISKITV